MLRNGVFVAVASTPLALEYESLCCSPAHQRAAGVTATEGAAFAAAVVALCEPVLVYFLWRPQLRDPGDEMVLEAAVNGRADVLVTFNRRDYGDVPDRFGLEVLLPRDLLERIRR